MSEEIKEILDYFQKDVDKHEESKRYLMKKYGYDEETIDNISQHERHIKIKKLLDYITNLQQENERLRNDLENEIADNKLRWQEYNFFKNKYIEERTKNAQAIEYIKSIDEDTLNSMFLDESYISNYGAIDLLNILQNGSDSL